LEKGFILKDYGQTKFFEIPSFNKSGLVTHCFTTRLGGVGSEPYSSMNLAFHVGDNSRTVVLNRKIICSALKVEMGNIISAQQVHGVNIEVVGQGHAGMGAYSYDTAIPDTDGLVTDQPGLILATFYADCVPIFILDPVKKVIASIHAGWKGTIAQIGALAVRKMIDSFDTNPSDCLVGIGPSIGPCCYEVDEPVISNIKDNFKWWNEVLRFQEDGRAFLNLWDANRRIMVEAGIKQNNVESARICTCCNRNILFSFRGDKGQTGRMGAFIMLKP